MGPLTLFVAFIGLLFFLSTISMKVVMVPLSIFFILFTILSVLNMKTLGDVVISTVLGSATFFLIQYTYENFFA